MTLVRTISRFHMPPTPCLRLLPPPSSVTPRLSGTQTPDRVARSLVSTCSTAGPSRGGGNRYGDEPRRNSDRRISSTSSPSSSSSSSSGRGASGPASASASSTLTSVANPLVKHLAKLRSSAPYRSESGSVLIPGLTNVTEVLEAMPPNRSLKLRTLLLQEGAPGEAAWRSLAPLLGGSSASVQVAYAAEHVMKKVSGLDNVEGTGVICELERPGPTDFSQAKPRRLLALEGIQDPGNLGTLLRTAIAFGWDGVFLLTGCCDLFNDKAIRASRGAVFRLPWAAGTWSDLTQIAADSGLTLLAAEPEPPSPTPLPASARESCCLVLGAEGKGLSAEALSRCQPVAIPMPGDMESLNVGVAGGILMFFLSPAAGQLGARFSGAAATE